MAMFLGKPDDIEAVVDLLFDAIIMFVHMTVKVVTFTRPEAIFLDC